MPRNSLPSLRAQIAKLEQKAETIKRQVVSRLQREIKAHGLTSEDLFGPTIVGNGRSAKATGTPRSASGGAREPRYGDAAGNVWGGMGKRPQWLKDRLEAGASLEEFLLAGRPAALPKRAKRSVSKAAPGRKKAAAKAATKTRTPRKTVARTADTAE
jgi:DNA-binding protein H-NS